MTQDETFTCSDSPNPEPEVTSRSDRVQLLHCWFEHQPDSVSGFNYNDKVEVSDVSSRSFQMQISLYKCGVVIS